MVATTATATAAATLVHLEYKVPVLRINVVLGPLARVLLETSAASDIPAAVIDTVEIVFPSLCESLRTLVIIMDFDPVILGIPRHAVIFEPSMPGLKGGCPEVHDQRLMPLLQPANGCTFLATS